MASFFTRAVTTHLFNNDAFWTALSSANSDTQIALRRLNCILHLAPAVRGEMLESLKKTKAKKRKNYNRSFCFVAGKANDLLFKQPQSTLHRAVALMFKYQPDSIYATTMSSHEAKRQFSIAVRDVRGKIRIAAADTTSEGHAAASCFFRITMLTLLPLVLARKGGLRHVSRAVISREKTKAKAIEAYIPIAISFVETSVCP